MAVYFQKVAEDQFHEDASFVVKESKKMRLFIGLLTLGIAILMSRSSIWLAIPIAAFSVASLLASRKNRVIMIINKEGFFYYGKLLTDWTNFVSARFIDQVPQLSKSSLGISDQFYIAIRYHKDHDSNCYESKIALTNTQDKAEEEILAAIRFYYKKYQDGESLSSLH
ncbi:MAG: hypothetical protein M3Q06_11065 [Bacteroidota bacterium]|nr:hypothetical protein [Bacteroidota bacterium]